MVSTPVPKSSCFQLHHLKRQITERKSSPAFPYNVVKNRILPLVTLDFYSVGKAVATSDFCINFDITVYTGPKN